MFPYDLAGLCVRVCTMCMHYGWCREDGAGGLNVETSHYSTWIKMLFPILYYLQAVFPRWGGPHGTDASPNWNYCAVRRMTTAQLWYNANLYLCLLQYKSSVILLSSFFMSMMYQSMKVELSRIVDQSDFPLDLNYRPADVCGIPGNALSSCSIYCIWQ